MSSSVTYAKKGGRKHESKNGNANALPARGVDADERDVVPAASAAVVPEVSAEKISERLPPSPWETDHTIKVTHETTYLYKCDTLEVTEVYSGIEFQKKFARAGFHTKERN